MLNTKPKKTKTLMAHKRLTHHIDSVLPYAHVFSQRASLFLSEDSDAVIKMIIKGQSQFRRHIARIHRVSLDWLFGWINLDLGIQIKYVNTFKQLADILNEGSFTRERWTQRTHLFILMTPQMHSCSRSLVLSPVQKGDKMSKRPPELITESATERPVRNLCASSHHSPKFVIKLYDLGGTKP